MILMSRLTWKKSLNIYIQLDNISMFKIMQQKAHCMQRTTWCRTAFLDVTCTWHIRNQYVFDLAGTYHILGGNLKHTGTNPRLTQFCHVCAPSYGIHTWQIRLWPSTYVTHTQHQRTAYADDVILGLMTSHTADWRAYPLRIEQFWYPALKSTTYVIVWGKHNI